MNAKEKLKQLLYDYRKGNNDNFKLRLKLLDELELEAKKKVFDDLEEGGLDICMGNCDISYINHYEKLKKKHLEVN